MAKSMRSKREKRLRAIRREMVEPLYDKKDIAKQAALDAALSAPKLPVCSFSSISMDVEAAADGGVVNQIKESLSLKPAGGVGKKLKKRGGFKVGKKNKGRGRWKPGKKHNI